MTMYKLINDSISGQPLQCIKRIADNAFIPFDPANMDYVAYLKWLEEGGQPLPADEVTGE
jgi:hypothetical protein